MKVSDLIRELNTFLDEHGDLDVKIFADHGQVHMSPVDVRLAYTEDKESYCSEYIHPDDACDSDEKVCEIDG